MTRPTLLRTPLIVLALAAAAPQAAGAATAPGRVAFGVGAPAPASHVDAGGASLAVALPDGRVTLLAGERGKGVVAARLRPDGTLDRAFGRGGVAHVAIPVPPPSDRRQTAMSFAPLQALARGGGGVLLVGSVTPRTRFELPRLMVVALRADGSLDPGFGRRGVADTTIQASCGGGCPIASLLPDGRIVVTGNTGAADPAIATDSNAPVRFQWVVARLNADGSRDASFGGGAGLVEIPGAAGRNGAGFATGLLPDGRIVAFGRGASDPLLTRLLPDGGADPSFHGGTPVAPPIPFGFEMLVHGDGRVDLLSDMRMVRYRADGEQDGSFASGGVLDFPAPGLGGRLLSLPDGAVLHYHPASFEPRPPVQGDLTVRRITPEGRFDELTGGAAGRVVGLGFGGGMATRFARRVPRVPTELAQSGFTLGRLVQRPDGSLLVAGGVRIVRYTGEGAGFSTGLFAAAALTPALQPDPSFGGPAVRPRLRLDVPSQRLHSVRRLKRVLVRAESSAPGLARVDVSAGGRTVASMTEPLFRSGASNLRIRLTGEGERMLRRRRGGLRVTVVARVRDVVAQERSATVRGVVRR